MPQITQLSYVFASQLFWLAVVFGIIFFGIGRGMLPKIQSTVEDREKKIGEDLERAQAARAGAEETEAAWRARMDAARADAARIAHEAKAESAKATEAKVRKAADKIELKVEAAEQKIRDAADATQDMVARLTGIKVAKTEAADAVKAELNV
jgi:F-type H+-transporting ATPase subunit b